MVASGRDRPASYGGSRWLAIAAEAMRLAKYLAHAGVASRRAAEEIVRRRTRARRRRAGHRPGPRRRRGQRGERRRAPAERARGARRLRAQQAARRRLHGARHARPADRRRARSARRARLYPVGRLDADSTGLILLTNDGELANLLTHPRYEVPKTYRARVGGGPPAAHALRSPARRASSSTTGRPRRRGCAGSGRDVIELELREGRKRQVRRMCEAVGHPVLELARVRFGPLRARTASRPARTGASSEAEVGAPARAL